MREFEGRPRGQGRRIAIVVSRFNEIVTRELLAEAQACLVEQGVEPEEITVAWVPGAWEIPSAIRRLYAREERAGFAPSGRRGFDAMIALGAVIRGGTPHFEYVAGGVTQGLASLAVDLDVPVIFGILTTDDLQQALERAGSGAGNKGRDAALAALEMANLFDQLGA
jgi:6,7-dimethyl-8-ribityllumazine synthase